MISLDPKLIVPFLSAGAPPSVFKGGSFFLPNVPTLLIQFPVQLTHFQALLLFAAIISVAFGFVSRRKPLARLKYILWSLLLFLLIGIGIGWAMYPFSR